MNATEFMKLHKPQIRESSGFTFQSNRPAAKCADGFTVSIQASNTHYCTPREDGMDYYTSVELGYPSAADELITEYAENKETPTDTVYGFVPIETVNALVEKHGGIVEAVKVHL